MSRPQRFRNSIKAVIIDAGRVLLTQNRDHLGEFYLLPGGGQEFGESMTEALQRECREELDCEVTVGDLIGARDYIGSRHEFAAEDAHMHQVELMFACSLPPGQCPRLGPLPDEVGDWAQIGVAWVPLAELAAIRLYPSALRSWLPMLPDPPVRYLGPVN